MRHIGVPYMPMSIPGQEIRLWRAASANEDGGGFENPPITVLMGQPQDSCRCGQKKGWRYWKTSWPNVEGS